ncbi:disintegrin and metalloproteinase domain-containing protein 28 [Arapaima gigas]
MANRFLVLWVFTATTLICPTGGLCPELEGVKDCEVITPIQLHARHKRDAQSLRPDTMKYKIPIEGKDLVMHLERNEGLLAKYYTETTYNQDGTPVTTTPQDLDHCYYHGWIVNDKESMISLSTCDGLRGYVQTAAQQYLIEPLPGVKDGAHALFRYEALEAEPPVCGVTNSSWEPVYPPLISKTRSHSSGQSPIQQQKYLELYLIADNREYKKMNSNPNDLRKRIFEVVNYVNLVYKPLNTFIALTGLEIWTDQDQIAVSTPAGQTLDAFTKWRNSYLMKVKKHDNAHLITGIDFDGATVGLAFIGTLCTDHSTGVIQDHNPRAIAVGATLAHEMGHNLGMNHDSSSCICTGSTCIMSAALSYDIPKYFSSCSDSNYEQFLSSRNPSCLFNKPDYKSLISAPVCGNGFIENGEQCDCGTIEECTNPCCNATTCTLTAGSQCAAGDCCEHCKVSRCRPQQDECDLAEYCTGKSTECPEDVFAVNGIPCKGGKGYCYNGMCPTRADQCIKIWGNTAEVATSDCYDQNTRGTYYAFCSRPSMTKYIGCQKKDVMCGKLFCTAGNTSPNYNRLVQFKNCKAIFSDDPDNDFGQVDTGIKCGDGMVCKDHECMDLETAYRATNCSAHCKGHAVCNHKRECQCEPGWLPPDCEQKDSASLAPGTIIAITVVIVLLILIVVGGVGGVLFMRKRRSSITHRHVHLKDEPGVKSLPFSQQMTPSNYQVKINRPKGPPPPPPASTQAQSPAHDLVMARKALRPPPHPQV